MKHVFYSIFVVLLTLVTVTAFGADVEADVEDDPLRFEEGENVERSVPENGHVWQPIGAPVAATGGNGDPLTYSFAEGDPRQTDGFILNGETGQLVAAKVFNYEESSPIEVTLSVTDGTTVVETTVQISVTNVNEAPRFDRRSEIRRGVIGLAGTSIGEPVLATDPDLTELNADANPDTPEADTLTYTLGGRSADLFEIDSTTGQLMTTAPANYGGIDYRVTVTVSDGHFTHSTTIHIFLAPLNISEIVDVTSPEVRISVPDGVQNSAFDAVITFTEEVSDFEQADLTLSGTATASITGWSTTDDTVWTATITPTTSGEVVVSVMADVATDAASNNNTASESETVTVDVTSPEVRISVPDGVQNSAFDAVITFTEEVSDFEQADLTLSGTATASITGWSTTDDTVWTATITPTTSGEVVVSVMADVATDAASNNNTASESETVTVDVTSPEVRISVPDGVQNSAFNAVITFTEEVSDFEQADVTLSGTATASITGWSTTDDTVFTATITPTTSGDVVVNVMADVATDAASNNNTASESETVTVDVTPPEVRISVPDGVQNSEFNVVITFTEVVSDFERADVTLSGTATASIGGWSTTDDTVFTVKIIPTTSGEVVVSVRADAATDAAGNSNTASESQTVTVDMPPGVSISVPDGDQNATFDVTITFTEVVAGFDQTDLTLSGTATASITGWSTTDDTVFTATITPTTSGTLTLSIAEGAVSDTAGNTNVLSTAEEVSIFLGVPLIAAGDLEVALTPEFVSVCDRTPEVRDAILAALPGVSDCEDVTAADLANITELRFGGQVVITLQANDFRGLTGLQRLQLHDTSNLPAGIFDDLTALETLSLFNNRLRNLPDGIFDNLTALKELGLLYNSLSSLPVGLFDKLTALETLSLADTDLRSFPDSIFDELTELKTLYLLDNGLSSLPAGLFDKLTALETLSLADPGLSSFLAGLFDELTALKTLSLENTSLNTFPAGLFDKLTALETLSLENNVLSGLPDDIFDELTELKQLNLSQNALRIFPAGVFDELIKLEELRLESNGLSSLPADFFDRLIALQYIFLGNNALSSLPDGLFNGLTALKSIDLSNNAGAPFPVTVSLEKVGEGQFRATAPTGAPYDIVLPLIVTNGSIDGGGAPSVTISTGTIKSELVTVTRTPGTADAVTVDIEDLPPPPIHETGAPLHSGYELVTSSDLPLTVIEGPGAAAPAIAAGVVVPDETRLSANYPNPFNPETWIPYQLANPSDVVIRIYDGRGQIVRRLELGHQPAGYYTRRSRAAYWDGRNDLGERVSSGLYFYHLRADNLSLLRKMVILK